MEFALWTLRYSPALGSFDDSEVRTSLGTGALSSLEAHFFDVDGLPHLALFARWEEPPPAPGSQPRTVPNGNDHGKGKKPRAPRRPDPALELNQAERERFEALRAWRVARARQDGVPAYRLLTNRQLVEVARRRPQSEEALAAIPGIGARTIERIGREVLAALPGGAARDAAPAADAETVGPSP